MENHGKTGFSIGDKIGLQTLIDIFEKARDGVVKGIRILPNNVLKYDIDVHLFGDLHNGHPIGTLRINNIHQSVVHDPFENGFHYNSKRDLESRREEPKLKKVPLTKKEILFSFWNPGFVFPPEVVEANDQCSDFVLVDIDGNRENFVIAYYDYENKMWNSTSCDELNKEEIVWRYLPLKKYENNEVELKSI